MCGIFGYVGKTQNETELFEAFQNIKARGPDGSRFLQAESFVPTYLGFHRLILMDLSSKGDQPFYYEDDEIRVYTGCNGEIYNYKELAKKHDLKMESGSDCEVIIHLYLKYGMNKLMELINGEFAFFIIEFSKTKEQVTLYLSRDQAGIRPLFYGYTDSTFAFSSEVKGLTVNMGKPGVRQVVPDILHFPPRQYLKLDFWNENGTVAMKQSWSTYLDFTKVPVTIYDEEEACKAIRESVIKATLSRIMCNREYGTLLSGGLDSSLTTAIVAKELAKTGKKLRTFCIGLPGATDKDYAELVAKHIGSEHTHIEMAEEDFLKEIDNITQISESYCFMTLRGTISNYLVAKWIRDNTNVKALIVGDGSDELTGGYMFFHNAPSPEESHQGNLKLINDIHYHDVNRVDRSIAANGLEARVPFLDTEVIKTYLSIDPKLRVPLPNHKGVIIEKYLLRKAFLGTGLIPDEVLTRKKEGFSDGVSSLKRSWYEVIQERINKRITDKEFEEKRVQYSHLQPHTKEALHYREAFERLFGKGPVEKVMPFHWYPYWSDGLSDPGSRNCKSYDENKRTVPTSSGKR